MKNQVSVFCVNSLGFMCQWKGIRIIEKTPNSISIQFTKTKGSKYSLLTQGISFFLVTKEPIKDLGVCFSKNKEAICFDDELVEKVLASTQNNVAALWQDGEWKA